VVTDAVLVVDKPVGPTSFAVVRQIRHASGVRRVGHGGTLDPLASGVLPVCLGEATKLAPFLLDADKEYDVTIRFGVETDTDDSDGTVVAEHDPGGVSEQALRAALERFRGPISQVPPAFAAIKRDGRPLYAYARAGTPIAVAPRAVTVHALELLAFAGPADVRLHVHSSKGTYVRALARDLGRALEVGAHVTALRRTRSGPFALTEARPLAEVLATLTGHLSAALPLVGLASALRHFPHLQVEEALARDLRAGKRVSWAAATHASLEPRVCLLDPAGQLIAVAEPRPDGLVRTLRVFGASGAKNPSEPANLR
jgi:tRNA pseudouridine55 synthase